MLVASRPFDYLSQSVSLNLEKLVKDRRNSSDTKFEPEEKTKVYCPRTVEGFEVHGGIARYYSRLLLLSLILLLAYRGVLVKLISARPLTLRVSMVVLRVCSSFKTAL